ncbi:MAG: DUF2070 family protein [bacterium]|nr:DUF2070 family protein [bacterium]
MKNEQFYSSLHKYFFSFPSSRTLSALLSCLLASSLFFSWQRHSWQLLALEIYTLAALLLLRELKLLDLAERKRFLGSCTIVAAFFFLVILLNKPVFLVFSPFFFFLFLEALSYRIFFPKTVYLAVSLAIPLLVFAALSAPVLSFMLLLVQLCYFLLLHAYRKKQRQKFGLDPYILCKLYIYWKFTGNSSPFEVFLQRYAVKRDVKVDVCVLYDYNYRRVGVLVFPHFHFGPFAGAGSACFLEELQKLLPEAVIFHCEGSHELNIASARAARELARKVSEVVARQEKPTYIKFSRPVVVYQGDLRCTGLELSGKVLYFVERRIKPSDDIPEQVFSLIGLRENELLIEMHNNYSRQGCEWNWKELRACIEECRKQLQRSPRYYGKLRLRKIAGLGERDILKGGIALLELLSPEQRTAILVVDANNILPEARNLLERLLRRQYDEVLVVSTDNHAGTLVGNGRLYYPAFSCTPIQAVLDELFAVQPTEAVYCEWRELVELVPVMGEAYEKMVRMIDEASHVVLATQFLLALSLITLVI